MRKKIARKFQETCEEAQKVERDHGDPSYEKLPDGKANTDNNSDDGAANKDEESSARKMSADSDLQQQKQ
jgi:hypothetical protein